MNTVRFISELGYALGDPSNTIYSSASLNSAMYRAVREYSRWRPLSKLIGSANLYAAATAGDTTLQLLGGPFVVGNVLYIDIAGVGTPEQVTILSVAMTSADSDGIGAPQTITVAPIAHNHAIGCVCVNQQPGIAVNPGVSTYALPYDLISLDQESFSLQTGQRSAIKKYESFYDAVTWFSNMLGGVGYGQSQTFSAYGIGAFGALASGPGSSIAVPGGLGTESMYVVTPGVPPILTITPAPTQFSWLNPVFYYGQHVPATIPDYDLDALLAYAQYAAINSRIARTPTVSDVTDGKQSISAARGMEALRKQGADALAEWKRYITDLPFCISG